jgi:hypothetical protein
MSPDQHGQRSASGIRSRIANKLGTLVPMTHDLAFNRDRNVNVPTSRAPRRGYAPQLFRERNPHIIVVSPEGPSFESWRPGTRNLYFEAWLSAREHFGDDAVSVLDVPHGQLAHTWHARLRELINEKSATHLLMHMESDPGSPDIWTWDEFWNQTAQEWDGVLLGVAFDSAYDLVKMKLRRLARISPNFMAVDICTPLTGTLVRRRHEVGPVNMPVSEASLRLVEERIADVSKSYDVSFIGALYPYRTELISRLESLGISVAVNPHRVDTTHDFASSRKDQPEWLEYMAGLAGSRMTINFSRSSAGEFEQLKTRVLEATLAGTVLLTDDVTSTSRFFVPEREYAPFRSVEDLPAVVQQWLSDPSRLVQAQGEAKIRAREIAVSSFWDGIEEGLALRGLPLLPNV